MIGGIPITKKQRYLAGRTDLVALLRSRGETLKKLGSEWEWKFHDERVTIRNNVWFDQYTQKGGDAVDFFRYFYGESEEQAAAMLLNCSVQDQEKLPARSPPVSSRPKQEEPKQLEIPSVNGHMQRVFAYLCQCKNRHPSPICTRFEHHFHALKPHLHRRSFSDTLPENQRHLIALKRHPLWHMQKLCQLSQPAELRSTFFRNRNAVLCQDVLQLSNPLALSLEFFLSCVKVFHRLTLHLVVAGPFQF